MFVFLFLFCVQVGDKVGAVVSSEARAALVTRQKALTKQRKAEYTSMYAERVKELEATLADTDTKYRIVEVEMEAKASKSAMDVCKASNKTVLLFCIGEDSVLCFAHVNTSDSGGMRADEWLKAVVESAGGKSGGSAAVARGSFPRQSLPLAQETANSWASEYSP